MNVAQGGVGKNTPFINYGKKISLNQSLHSSLKSGVLMVLFIKIMNQGSLRLRNHLTFLILNTRRRLKNIS